MANTAEEITKQLKEIKNSVSIFEKFLPTLVQYLTVLCKEFKAGQVATHFSAWVNITSDKDILNNIRGVIIDCKSKPVQHTLPPQKFSYTENPIVDREVSKLLNKVVITEAYYEADQIVSNIFLSPKQDGTYRLILNLKRFNEFVSCHHFKMDSIHTITKLVTRNCFMATLDLKDAYYSIPINKEHQKFLRFKRKEKLYQFTCLPNGLSCAPQKFTKTLKPALATLHTKGHISTAHIDDCYMQGQTYARCVENVIDHVMMFTNLGFVPHPSKSSLLPSQKIITLSSQVQAPPVEAPLCSAPHPVSEASVVIVCWGSCRCSVWYVSMLSIHQFSSLLPSGVRYIWASKSPLDRFNATLLSFSSCL